MSTSPSATRISPPLWRRTLRHGRHRRPHRPGRQTNPFPHRLLRGAGRRTDLVFGGGGHALTVGTRDYPNNAPPTGLTHPTGNTVYFARVVHVSRTGLVHKQEAP